MSSKSNRARLIYLQDATLECEDTRQRQSTGNESKKKDTKLLLILAVLSDPELHDFKIIGAILKSVSAIISL